MKLFKFGFSKLNSFFSKALGSNENNSDVIQDKVVELPLTEEIKAKGDVKLDSLFRTMNSGSNLIKQTTSDIQTFEEKVLAMVQKGDDIDLGLQTLQMRSSDVQESYGEMSGNILALAETKNKLEEIQQIIDEVLENSKKISQIAFKAQLLSFNASIEAARAGAAGRGFSVVAQEVGVLAQMSQDTALEISANLKCNKETIDVIVGDVGKNIDRTKELEGTVSDYFVNLVNMMDEVKVQSNAIKVEGNVLEEDLGVFASDLTGALTGQLQGISDSVAEISGKEIYEISPTDLEANRNNYHIVDLRPENAFGSDDGIEGSHRFNMLDLDNHLNGLDKSKPVVFVCENGEEAFGACLKAQAMKFGSVHRMTGGMEAWNSDVLNQSNDIASAF